MLVAEPVRVETMLKHIRLERPLVVFDLETTGRKVEADRIIEISTLKILPDGSNRIHTRRVNPGIPIHPEATAVHGITDADLADERPFAEIAPGLARYLDGCDLCGYNIWSFDLKILVAEFRRVNVPFATAGRHIVDPCRIFFKREPRDLTAALRFYCNMAHDGAHAAEADVLAALLVLDGQAAHYADLPRTIPELHDLMEYPDVVDPDGKFIRRADGATAFAFGKYRDDSVDDVAGIDPGYLEWVLKSEFSPEARVVVRQALDRRAAGGGRLVAEKLPMARSRPLATGGTEPA